MADAASNTPKATKTAAAAPADPAAAVVLAAKPAAQTLRSAQIKRLSTGRLKPVGHFSDPQQALLPADWDFTDALNPDFWALIAPGLQANVAASILHDRLGTMIDVTSEDHAFYGRVMVRALRRNKDGVADGAYVTCIGPIYDPETKKCCPVDVKTGGIWKGRPSAAAAA